MDTGILGRVGDTQTNGLSRRASRSVHGVRGSKGTMEQEGDELARVPEIFLLGSGSRGGLGSQVSNVTSEGNGENKLTMGFL